MSERQTWVMVIPVDYRGKKRREGVYSVLATEEADAREPSVSVRPR